MADHQFAQAESTPPSRAYTAQLSQGQRVHIQNDGRMTTLTLTTVGPSQQQQSSSQLMTGDWTSEPGLFQVSYGYVIIATNRADKYYFQIQSGQVQASSDFPSTAITDALQTSNTIPMQPATNQTQKTTPSTVPSMEPMKPMEAMDPMDPMKPMAMGNMRMSPLSPAGPMSMTMGNMSMSTADLSEETAAKTPATAKTDDESKVKRFCSQCGGAIAASDRFCAYCGHQLTP